MLQGLGGGGGRQSQVIIKPHEKSENIFDGKFHFLLSLNV